MSILTYQCLIFQYIVRFSDMYLFRKKSIYFLVLLLVGSTILSTKIFAKELRRLKNVKYIDNPSNDGDSFTIKAGRRSYRLRLYYVDCPETSAPTRNDAQRVKEQTRHFGLNSIDDTFKFGNKATTLVKTLLKNKRFTVHTEFADAMGRSKRGRIYGFVTLVGGEDLADRLIKEGLARVYGMARETPTGVSKKRAWAKLRTLEDVAQLKRAGVWSVSNPNKLLKWREQLWDEKLKLVTIQRRGQAAQQSKRIDINNAHLKELLLIDGIGRSMARRIIKGRPYASIKDLLKVSGIGKKKLKAIRSQIRVTRK